MKLNADHIAILRALAGSSRDAPLTVGELRDAADLHDTAHTVFNRLRKLHQAELIEQTARAHWTITDKGRLALGEPSSVALPEDGPRQDERCAPVAALPVRPVNSVFALGAALLGHSGLVQEVPVVHHDVELDDIELPLPPQPVLRWQAPAQPEAEAARPADAPAAAPDARQALLEAFDDVADGLKAAAARSRAAPPSDTPDDFRCALFDTGALLLHMDGQRIELNLDRTYRLCMYLDQVRRVVPA